MKETICLNVSIDVKEPSLKEITEAFKKAMLGCYENFVNKVLITFANEYKKNGNLAKLLNCSKVMWKTSRGNKKTSIFTIFGKI